MLLVAYELKEPLSYIKKNISHLEFQQIAFNASDWFVIEHLIKIFEIFVKPSTKLQGETYVTLSTALLYIYKIYADLDTLYRLFITQSSQDMPSVSYLF